MNFRADPFSLGSVFSGLSNKYIQSSNIWNYPINKSIDQILVNYYKKRKRILVQSKKMVFSLKILIQE